MYSILTLHLHYLYGCHAEETNLLHKYITYQIIARACNNIEDVHLTIHDKKEQQL